MMEFSQVVSEFQPELVTVQKILTVRKNWPLRANQNLGKTYSGVWLDYRFWLCITLTISFADILFSMKDTTHYSLQHIRGMIVIMPWMRSFYFFWSWRLSTLCAELSSSLRAIKCQNSSLQALEWRRVCRGLRLLQSVKNFCACLFPVDAH